MFSMVDAILTYFTCRLEKKAPLPFRFFSTSWGASSSSKILRLRFSAWSSRIVASWSFILVNKALFFSCTQERSVSAFWVRGLKSFRALTSSFLSRSTSSKHFSWKLSGEAIDVMKIGCVTGRSKGSLRGFIGEVRGAASLRFLLPAFSIWWKLLILVSLRVVTLLGRGGFGSKVPRPRLFLRPRPLEELGDRMFWIWNKKRYGVGKEYFSNFRQHSIKLYFWMAVWPSLLEVGVQFWTDLERSKKETDSYSKNSFKFF